MASSSFKSMRMRRGRPRGPAARRTGGPVGRWTGGPVDRWTGGPVGRWTMLVEDDPIDLADRCAGWGWVGREREDPGGAGS